MNSSSAKLQAVPHVPITSLTKRLVAGVIALNLVVAGILCFSLHQSRLQNLEHARVVSGNIAQVLEENLIAIVNRADIALQAVSDEAERQLAAGSIQKLALNNYIIREHSRLPELVAFRATDASGDAIYGSAATPVKTTSLAHRDYFKFLQKTPGAGLVISKPLIGGITGKRMIVLARRINHPDGTFAGLTYAGISLDHLTKIFSEINVGTNGSLSLIDADSTLVARYPAYNANNSHIGQKIQSRQLSELLQAGKDSGTYVTKSSTDSVERMYTFHKLSFSNPLYVFVGLATADILADWHAEVIKMSCFMLIFLCITTVLTRLFHKALCRSKEAEQAIVASEERFRALHDATFNGIIIHDKGLILECNQGLSNMTGFTTEELLGMDGLTLIAPDWLDLVVHNIQIGYENSYEVEGLRKDGSRYPLAIKGKNVSYKGRNARVIEFRDITDIKKAEQEKLQLEQQLLQTQKLESLGVLAGGIAHDFNNLLAIIIGHCSLARLRPATAVDSIKPIETAATRAAALCQQMLAYAGKAHFIKSQAHLDELVDDMVKMAQSTIGKNVEIICDLAADIPPIMVDASQIRQVTMNLIINASEAIGASQGVVRVSLAKRTVGTDHQEKDHLGAVIPAGCYACLEVSDTGCGMDDETKLRIFEPFYTTKFTGRGLGMSAVLGIIKAHNGALQLFSQPGQGARFKVFLPIQTTDPAEVPSPQPVTPTVPWKGNGTVLLVEDEETIRNIAEEMLAELGFSVITACNGYEALELYRQHASEIRLTLTDVGMPVMDGYALTKELKSIDAKLPIIISSGFGNVDVSEHIAPEHIAGLISKPYSFDKMQEVLKSVVEAEHLNE